MERKLDILLSILNSIEKDVVKFYTIEYVDRIEVCIEKNGKRYTLLAFSGDTNDNKLSDFCSVELIRYLMFSKDNNDICNINGAPVKVLSAKTIFNVK